MSEFSTNSSDKFPKQTTATIAINGVVTEIVSTAFDDYTYVIISQIKKFGTMIRAWSDTRADGGKIYDCRSILGKRNDPLMEIYARQIIEKSSKYSNVPILLAISLKPIEGQYSMIPAILDEVYRISGWIS